MFLPIAFIGTSPNSVSMFHFSLEKSNPGVVDDNDNKQPEASNKENKNAE